YARLPDGRVTSALVPADDLARRWRGRAAFEDVMALAGREDYRLLRTSRVGGEGEGGGRYVSLGHGARAPVAAAWGEGGVGAARVRQVVGLAFALAFAALALIGGLSLLLLRAAEDSAREELIDNSHLSSGLAAEFAAEKLPWKVRRTWQSMQEQAGQSK